MSVIIQCPSCESRLKVVEDMRGRKINCPKCEYGFQVVAEPTPTDKPPLDADDSDYQRPRSARRAHADNGDFDDADNDERPRRRRVDTDEDDRGEADRGEADSGERNIVLKKKRKKKKKTPAWVVVTATAGGGVVVLGLAVWLLIAFVFSDGPVQPVTTWEKYVSGDEEDFGFEYPALWRERSYGRRDFREVEISGPGGAMISIKEVPLLSLMGEIANPIQIGGQVPEELKPNAVVHNRRRPEIKDYSEGKAETVRTRFGKLKRSPYTQGSKRGYRVTVVLDRASLDIFCECRDSDWAVLQPAFDHFISSLGRDLPP